jgi:arsenate reductase (glutaredoxin)
MTVVIHGIANCDTMKKARAWLDAQGVAHSFFDYRKTAPTETMLTGWLVHVGWETLLNRAGTTFRALPEADRADLDQAKAVRLMLAQPSMIKRPVLVVGERLIVGFKPEVYAAAFG